MPILVIFFLVGGTYYYLTSENKNFKEEHSKYISLINDSHDFNSGLKGLETLTTEKAKETLRNIDNEINIASELVKIDTALNNANIEEAHNHLKHAKKLNTGHTFTKAITYLEEQLENYDNALIEILKLDSTSPNYADQVKTILAKYEFKYSALKDKLLNSETSELEQDHKTNVTKKEEEKKELSNKEDSKKKNHLRIKEALLENKLQLILKRHLLYLIQKSTHKLSVNKFQKLTIQSDILKREQQVEV